jgi:hypothetical protein
MKNLEEVIAMGGEVSLVEVEQLGLFEEDAVTPDDVANAQSDAAWSAAEALSGSLKGA